MIWIVIILAWLGLCAGSFVNALVWRLHEQKKAKKRRNDKVDLSILKGRSVCPDCKHQLAWYDLIPLVSWVILKGKCRYCKRPISIQYPIVEATAGLVFVGSYLFWPVTVHQSGQGLLLTTWLISSVGLLALAVYDLRWMILPNRIIYPTLAAAAAGRLAYLVGWEHRRLHAVVLWAASLLIASGLFYVLFETSKGKWIGFGDVRLGLITGTLLATPQKSLLMIFLASLLGSLVAMPALVRGRKTLASKLPFGPFLIAATAIAVVFGNSILDHYARFMGLN